MFQKKCLNEELNLCIKESLLLSTWLVLAGSIFVAVVSLIAAFRVEGLVLKIMLILSTMVTLAIAVWRLYNSQRMNDEITKLKDGKQYFILCIKYNDTLSHGRLPYNYIIW